MKAAKKRDGLGSAVRWAVLHRDNFTCAYCGDRPGNIRLQADHMIGVAAGGSDHENNLVASCDKCNLQKRDSIAIPRKLLDGEKDGDGWIVWRRWGSWLLKWNPKDTKARYGYFPVVLSDSDSPGYEYWIALTRVHEPGWFSHLKGKVWFTPEVAENFLNAIDFACTLMEQP